VSRLFNASLYTGGIYAVLMGVPASETREASSFGSCGLLPVESACSFVFCCVCADRLAGLGASPEKRRENKALTDGRRDGSCLVTSEACILTVRCRSYCTYLGTSSIKHQTLQISLHFSKTTWER